jgi:hypothetical protein
MTAKSAGKRFREFDFAGSVGTYKAVAEISSGVETFVPTADASHGLNAEPGPASIYSDAGPARWSRTVWAGSSGHCLGSAGRPDRRRRIAARADVAIVAIRRPTGTFPGAGTAFSGAGTGPAGGAADGESAVGASLTVGAAGGAAAGDPASGRAAYGQPAEAAGGLGWDPLCQVRARITWVGES